MRRKRRYGWTIGALIAAFTIGGAVALAHGYGRDDSPYLGGVIAGELPAELAQAALEALDAEYAMYAAYEGVIRASDELEPYSTLRDISAHNIAILMELLEGYGVAYPRTNPYLEGAAATEGLGEAAGKLAGMAADKGAMYGELVRRAAGYRALGRLFSYLGRVSLRWELPALELAARSGGKLSAAQMAGLGFGLKRGPSDPFGIMAGERDGHCPWHAMWEGPMRRARAHGAWGGCH